MLNPRLRRSSTKPRWIDERSMRFDPALRADLTRTRAARASRLLGRTTPFELKTPWLTLSPARPIVEGKGYLEYTSPTYVGMGQFDEGERLFAAFELIFQKSEPGEFSIERPAVSIRLTDPPSPDMLVEIDLHAHDTPPGDPRFEVWAAQQQTVTVPDGKRQELMFVMRDFFSIRSAWADGGEFFDRDGNWAFFEARITPVA